MEEQNNKSEFDQIKELILLWLKHWYVFLISLIICGTFGLLYYKLKTPEYKLSAKVSLRNDNMSGGGMSESSMMRSLGIGKSSAGNIEDESNIMGSHGYLTKMVENLELNDVYILKEFLGLWNTELDKYTSPILVSYDREKINSLNAFFVFDIATKKDGSAKIKGKMNKEKLGTFDIQSLPGTIKTNYGEFTFSKSSITNKYDDPVKLEIRIASADFIAQIYEDILVVDFLKKNSDVMTLEMVDKNVSRGKDILNEVINVYNHEYATDKEFVGNKTVDFLNGRLKIVREELLETDRAIELFKQKYKLTDIEADASAFLEQNIDIQSKLIEAETQLNIVELIDEFISNPNNKDELIPFNLAITDKGLSDVIISYNELVIKRNGILSSSNEKSLIAIQLNDQISTLRGNLILSLTNVKKSIQISLNNLKKKEVELGKRITDVPEIEKQYVDLVRSQKVQQAVYIFLQEKKEQTALTSLTILPKLKIIDEPYAFHKPVAPNLKMIALAVIFLGGIFCPIVIIHLRQYRVNKKEK